MRVLLNPSVRSSTYVNSKQSFGMSVPTGAQEIYNAILKDPTGAFEKHGIISSIRDEIRQLAKNNQTSSNRLKLNLSTAISDIGINSAKGDILISSNISAKCRQLFLELHQTSR